MKIEIKKIESDENSLMDGMLDVFAEAFDDSESYSSKRPTPQYMAKLLKSESFVGLVAVQEGQVIGALVTCHG
ncbi:hypothetical protein G9X64_29455 [Rhizobium sophorae]|uniref:GNAT family N-acetyltransferase n=1 Tax=Rhizobium sophorae TaxID=1535242 RepID=A0A7Y3WH99_9HYPH|nr:hypothetical protein [Rhizobium sophorae]NNU40540.1 hypothetical protein [Rhizobium sophorae]